MPEKDEKTADISAGNFSGLLITGPFSILLGFEGGMMALNDRLKLRSMVAGQNAVTLSILPVRSAAIRIIAPDVPKIWSPRGGEPVIVDVEWR